MSGRPRSRGFVLVATIWLLAAMSVSVAYYALWMERQRDLWQDALDDARAEAALRGELATLKYLLATRPREAAGLRDLSGRLIRFDGRPYRPTRTIVATGRSTLQRTSRIIGPGADRGPPLVFDDPPTGGRGAAGEADEVPSTLRFALLDAAALVSLNGASGRAVEGLLARAGVPPGPRRLLVARLLDYIDTDTVLRPNGRESARDGAAPPPANRPLAYPGEFLAVAGWADLLTPAQQRFVEDHSTVFGPATLNLNAAPRAVLEGLSWLSPRDVTRLLAAREQSPFTGFEDLRSRVGLDTGVEFDRLVQTLYPTRFTRLSVWREGSPRVYQVNLRMAVGSELSTPWLVDHSGWARQPSWRGTEEEQ